ncbi:unnamed protein product [Brachionus calyciflorus]|uniref:Protein phosphatase n=1 Tax=Brachionus calyciflorus TaxID=104777 RepID=A0A814JAI9_9BILA|nr:unnamed protein product [Brachionus calyciflorus]
MFKIIRKQINAIRGLLNEYNRTQVLRSLTTRQIETSEQSQHKANFHLVTAFSGFSKEFFNTNQPPTINQKKIIIGDDSWFIANQKCADVMGIADGVGGWREMGVDPSKFSSNLMKQCKRIVEQDNAVFANCDGMSERTPLDILVQSYNCLIESKDQSLIGSSTACIVVFNRESKILYSANLGDSGFVIIRNNKIVFRSQEQYHYFNAPFQLALLPNMLNEENLFNDKPQSASVNAFQLLEGDFIVMATDGLWDNLSESHLLLKIANIKDCFKEDMQQAARNIASFAAELSQDPDYMSPFAISARKHGLNFRGGKPDDITVLLARVSKT